VSLYIGKAAKLQTWGCTLKPSAGPPVGYLNSRTATQGGSGSSLNSWYHSFPTVRRMKKKRITKHPLYNPRRKVVHACCFSLIGGTLKKEKNRLFDKRKKIDYFTVGVENFAGA
jgi:hypothetical protein